MHHTLLHSREQQRLAFRVWSVRPNAAVHILWHLDLVSWIKKDQEMHVREPMFLKLNGIDMCNSLPKDIILDDIIKYSLLLELKDSSGDVRAIFSTFTLLQLALNLWPVWVCCHRNEEINGAAVAAHSKQVLEKLLHIVWASCV
jgi:hypothetical protein